MKRWYCVLALAGAACGVSRGPVPGLAAPGLDSYVRQITPFPVVDRTGIAFEHAFLGGFNLPRPQLIDIDRDGDLDLFVQEYSGELMFFENVGSASRGLYVWRTDRYQGASIGEWYRFVDLNQDGLVDLLSERPFSHVRYYRNEGTPTAPSLVQSDDSLRNAAGVAIFADRQNIPQVTDIDCDGLLDLFVGQITGTVTRYESVGDDIRGTPRFEFVTDRFQGIEIVAQIGSAHGANTMAFTDIDLDGDEDLFWGDFFEPGLLFIENRGSCELPDLSGEPMAFPLNDPVATSGYNAPAFGDVDGDGDVDLLMGVLGGAFNPNRTTIDNLYHLEQNDDGTFTVVTARFLRGIDVGSESLPAFADLDGDGDLDLFLANKIDPDNLETSRIYRFENVGTRTEPAFREADPMPLEGAYHYAPALADLDGDGDIDMLLGTWRDEVAFYRNDGTSRAAEFVLVDSALVSLTRGSNAVPALGDLDADGDLDLMVGEGSGTINFYRNVGTEAAPAFELVSDRYSDIDVGRRSAPALADVDGDGDLDLVIGSETGGLALYRNVGTQRDPTFTLDEGFVLRVPPFAVPRFVDIDADGDLDLFSGGIGGGVVFYEHR